MVRFKRGKSIRCKNQYVESIDRLRFAQRPDFLPIGNLIRTKVIFTYMRNMQVKKFSYYSLRYLSKLNSTVYGKYAVVRQGVSSIGYLTSD